MINDLILYANYYHNLGMNISPIHGGNYKNPSDTDWESFLENEQSIKYIQSCQWSDATGIGCILGYNEYRALDIDFLFYSQEDLLLHEERDKKVEKFVSECLNLLRLPNDYPWVIKSGSGYGIHIIFRTQGVPISEKVYAYSPSDAYKGDPATDNGRLFKLIEFRCNCFLVLPPSLHDERNNHYAFYHDYIPEYKPFFVDISNIYKLLNHYCAEEYFQPCNYRNANLKLARKQKTVERYVSGSFEIAKVGDDLNLLNYCNDADAYNTIGCCYALGENITSDLSKSIEYFKLANNEMAHYNIASLMACGAVEGTTDLIKNHLCLCHSIEQKHIDIVKENMSTLFHSNIDYLKKKSIQYLFFDTETTGLPNNYDAPSSDLQNWPRLVSLSWIITDELGNVLKKQDYIVYPDSFSIPIQASKLNGITTERAKAVGHPIKNILDLFMSDYSHSTYVVGHNIAFDKKIIGAELIRSGNQDIMDSKISYCTMESTVNFCKIPGYLTYKFPKLQELYKKLFGKEFEDAHNSLADVSATVECFWKLKELGIL